MLRFQLLGPVAAYGERGPVALGPARNRTVVAALVLNPGAAVSVEQLVERLWGDEPPRRARETLYTYLSRLRAAFADAGAGPMIVRSSHSYTLEVPPEAVDLHRFRALVRAARQATDDARGVDLWRDALAVWQGPPLADLDSDWARNTAAALEAERLTATLDHNDVLLRRGEHSPLLPDLTADAAVHPLDERLAGQLILTLYRSGRQADALAHYQQFRQRLVDHIGSEPGQALQHLHGQLLRQDPALTSAVPVGPATEAGHVADQPAAEGTNEAPDDGAVAVGRPAQLPADIPGFAGRSALLDQLDGHLGPAGDPPPRTVATTVISGYGGVGKTALAVHWAHRVRERFPDGQLYLDLRGFDPSGQAMSVAEALRVLLESLGVPPDQVPASVAAQTGRYRSRLAGTRTMVVLDNARDAHQVRPLLPGTAGCMALVTSRDQLAGLAATEGARLVQLDMLSDVEARQLLVHRLGDERVAAEPDAVRTIVAACGGLPLALAIVAARAATSPGFPLTAFAEELADAHGRLDALSSPDAATDARAVFSWSYDALSPAAARLFRLLGLHPGPDISRHAAASLAGLPVPEARRMLAELTRAHLVTEHTLGRYTCHDLLRAYAAELAHTVDGADQHVARHRMLDYYLHTTNAADELLPRSRRGLTLTPPVTGVVPETFADSAAAESWLTTEHRVLLAILDQGAHDIGGDQDGFDHHIQQLAQAINTFLLRFGRWHEKVTAHIAGLHAARRRGDRSAQAAIHRGLANAYERLERRDEAHSHIHEARRLCEEDGDHVGHARALEVLVWLSEREGRYQDGLRYARQALDSAVAVGDRKMQAIARHSIGWCHTLLGDHEQAIDHCRQALAELQELGDRIGLSDVWNSLGHAYRHLGQYQQAIDCYRQSVDWAHECGSRWSEAKNLVHLGDSHHDAGDTDAARLAWQRALDILHEIDSPEAGELRNRLSRI